MAKILKVSGLSEYYLISFDEVGLEIPDRTTGLVSNQMKQELRKAISDGSGFTDIFVVSHGWQSDHSGAREQYNLWFSQMAACETKIASIRLSQPNFKPLVVGLHWPSRICADLDLYGSEASRGSHSSDTDLVESLSDEARVQNALRSVLKEIDLYSNESDTTGRGNPSWHELMGRVPEAIQIVQSRFKIDKERIFATLTRFSETAASKENAEKKSASFALAAGLSFWRMRERARQFGQGAVHDLLKEIRSETKESPVRLHLVGHSFGCIVVSSAVLGSSPKGDTALTVNSLTLLQGALSQFAFCQDNPTYSGHQGEYHPIIEHIQGPMVITWSKWDFAVGYWYPIAARLWEFGEKPKAGSDPYGALGCFGANGNGISPSKLQMVKGQTTFPLRARQVFNVDASEVIADLARDPKSGAHCDLAHPELAELVWQASITQ